MVEEEEEEEEEVEQRVGKGTPTACKRRKRAGDGPMADGERRRTFPVRLQGAGCRSPYVDNSRRRLRKEASALATMIQVNII